MSWISTILMIGTFVFCGIVVWKPHDVPCALDVHDTTWIVREESKISPPLLKENVWCDPPRDARGEAWMFDLFTPPTIVWKNDQYEATLPWLLLPEPDEQKTFKLITFERQRYPIQLLGYVIPPPNVSGKSQPVFFLKNTETQETLQATLGDVVTKHQLELVDFQEKGPNHEIYPQLKLFDHELFREEMLTTELKDDTQRFQMTLQYGDTPIHLTHIGETFSIDNRQYTLQEIETQVRLECNGKIIVVES